MVETTQTWTHAVPTTQGNSDDLLILVESNFAEHSAVPDERFDEADEQQDSAFPAAMIGMALIVAAGAMGASLAVEIALASAGAVMVVLALSRWLFTRVAQRRAAVSRPDRQ
ncbi:hypothetical protein IFT84_04065 [Rhizobium sp. CFBP 8762]|uniref:hypothetical protein n=1 Tax=Rhizobium sp. CFBP 8762 TaxID=2775279 RepID=UPI00178457FF|nr:hypothetical protein [Rhizobium sp. CFBP 8762]MBD8553691.1 hypothetical protein [Rhizobium sp. CFBP 8762]